MFKEITVKDWNGNVFEKIGKDWMLISAEHEGNINAMTASWGGMGVLWNKQVVFIFVRPQRYTNTLLSKSDHLKSHMSNSMSLWIMRPILQKQRK